MLYAFCASRPPHPRAILTKHIHLTLKFAFHHLPTLKGGMGVLTITILGVFFNLTPVIVVTVAYNNFQGVKS